MKKVTYFILILAFLIVGCGKNTDVSQNYVKVTPSKLFEGDAKKLAPHFDMMTGCIKVKYQGDKESLCLKYEIWENGKIKESQNGISTSFDKNEFDGEISISLKDIIGTDLEKSDSMVMKTIISEDNGYIGSTKYIDRFDKECGYGPVEIDGELEVADSEDITVWGVTAYKGSFECGGKSIEDEVKTADWGLIFKISFK